MPPSMRDFNDSGFSFGSDECVLIDTSFLVGVINPFDPWQKTVSPLWDDHIATDEGPLLFVTSAIVSEVCHSFQCSLERVANELGVPCDDGFRFSARQKIVNILDPLLKNGTINIIDTKKEHVFHSNYFFVNYLVGSHDCAHLAVAFEEGLTFLTLDYTLVGNIRSLSAVKPLVRPEICYTTTLHRQFRVDLGAILGSAPVGLQELLK